MSKKLLKNLKGKITIFAIVMLALQAVLVAGAMPQKTFAATSAPAKKADAIIPADHVVISQVYVNSIHTIGSSESSEFVELYNPTASEVSLAGWQIVTNAGVDATLPAGAKIVSNGFYLIADASWDTQKDNPAWPAADYKEDITIKNSDSGVRLTDGESAVDEVGYGESSIYEGTPLSNSDIVEGMSIERNHVWQDTNDNEVDFSGDVTPNPRNSSTVDDILAPKVTWDQSGKSVALKSTLTGTVTDNVKTGLGVQVIINSGSTPLIANIDPSGNWSIAVTFSGAGNQDVEVRATDGNGNVSSLEGSVNVDTSWPGEVRDPLTATAGNNSVLLNWVNPDTLLPANADFNGVKIFRSTSEITTANPGTWIATVNKSTVNYSDSTVKNGTKYYYLIKTVDLLDNESPGRTINATPVAPIISPVVTTIPPTVTEVAAVAPVSNEVFGQDSGSSQGEVKADTTIKKDDQKPADDNKKTETKDKKSIPLWGIIFLLVLVGVGGYLFYVQSPTQQTSKVTTKTRKKK